MIEKIVAIESALADRYTTVHIFVSMLKSRGEPIALSNERVLEWMDAMHALQACRTKPCRVINTAVLTLIDDPIEKEKYRIDLERMIEYAEKYAFVDYGQRFWAEQFRLIDDRDIRGISKHCHLTLCRQRMFIRLCHKDKSRNSEAKAAQRYLDKYETDPKALSMNREMPAEEVESRDDEEIPSHSTNATTMPTSAGIGKETTHGDPDFERFWIPEDATSSCTRGRLADRHWNTERNACRKSSHCIYCASVRYKEEDKDAGFYDEEAVAILMLMRDHDQWTPLNVTSIFDYLLSLNENI
jgi:hypothetical protein